MWEIDIYAPDSQQTSSSFSSVPVELLGNGSAAIHTANVVVLLHTKGLKKRKIRWTLTWTLLMKTSLKKNSQLVPVLVCDSLELNFTIAINPVINGQKERMQNP